MDSALIEVITVTSDRADAQRIAALLLDRRLVACTQIHGPLESSYWWNDRIETAQEWQLVAKTTQELYSAAAVAIREAHPYDVPEILGINIGAVSPAYRMWLLGQLALPPKHAPAAPPADQTAGPAGPSDSAITRSKRAKGKKEPGA